MLTKEDYMKLPKERLAELLVERDLPVTHVPFIQTLPCYAPNELVKLLFEKGYTKYPLSYDGDYWYCYCQMAMKWLREVYKIFVEVSVCIDTNGDYHYHSMALDKICEYILPSIGTYGTYEEAVEAAILYVLNKVL